MTTSTKPHTKTYHLLDSGNGQKLEQVGKYRLIRPCPQAIWQPSLSKKAWKTAHAIYQRSKSGGGQWTYKSHLPESWNVNACFDRTMKIKLTNFGHLGVFPEQGPNWDWIHQQIQNAKRPINVLNTFAYTGGSTLAAAMAGANVVHLDSARGIVAWARENAEINQLKTKPIRWIIEDVSKFVAREIRRKRQYDAIILDPPSFGRGSKGEVFKFERDFPTLLSQCRQLLSHEPLFVLLSAHTPGFTPLALQNLLADMTTNLGGHLTCLEMTIPYQNGTRLLPSGVVARWCNF